MLVWWCTHTNDRPAGGKKNSFHSCCSVALTDYVKGIIYKNKTNLNFHFQNYIFCMYVEKKRERFLRGYETTKKCAVYFEKSSFKLFRLPV